MFCSKCGTLNLDDASFCKKCGNPLKGASGSTPQQTQPATTAPSVPQGHRKDPIIAAFLNLFIGLGYIYLGYRRVLGLPSILFVLIVLIIQILLGIFTFGLIPLVIAILMAYDGYVKAGGQKGLINTEPELLYQ